MKKASVAFLALTTAVTLSAANLFAEVSGVFKGNGKDAKIAFVTAKKGEPFSGKETVVVVLTEKDTAGDPKPDFNAAFGKFGNSLTLTFMKPEGDIIGCEVNHDGNKNKPFSSIGKIKAENFKIEGSDISAHVTTGGPATTFEDTWQVDLNFKAKIQ